jgi:hypothetical protein
MFSISEQIDAFAKKQHTRQSRLLNEFLARYDIPKAIRPVLLKNHCYDFEWGFVSESCGDLGLFTWNIYVQQAWKNGTEDYYDQFLSEWKSIAVPHLEDLYKDMGRKFHISFEIGTATFSAISLSCQVDNPHNNLGREWMSFSLLPKIWPDIMKNVFG